MSRQSAFTSMGASNQHPGCEKVSPCITPFDNACHSQFNYNTRFTIFFAFEQRCTRMSENSDRTKQIKSAVGDVVEAMKVRVHDRLKPVNRFHSFLIQENVDKLIERDYSLKHLDSRTDGMRSSAMLFKTSAEDLHERMKLRNQKIKAVVGILVTAILLIGVCYFLFRVQAN